MPPDNVEKALRALITEIYNLTDPAYFTDEQLASAKKILAVQSLYEQEETSSLVHTVSFWWCVAGLEYYTNYVPALNAVTRQDIAKFVNDYIVGKPFAAGLLASEDLAKKLGMTSESFTALVTKIEADVRAARTK